MLGERNQTLLGFLQTAPELVEADIGRDVFEHAVPMLILLSPVNTILPCRSDGFSGVM